MRFLLVITSMDRISVQTLSQDSLILTPRLTKESQRFKVPAEL